MTNDEAIKLLVNIAAYDIDSQRGEKKFEALWMAIEALEQKPKAGHWIGIDEEPHEDYECDKCGYVVSTFTANIEPHTEYKYCPNCGAKMFTPREIAQRCLTSRERREEV